MPSIVYGAFGVGFFCYGVGGWIDDVFFSASLLADSLHLAPAGFYGLLTLALLTLPVVIVATEEARSPYQIRCERDPTLAVQANGKLFVGLFCRELFLE